MSASRREFMETSAALAALHTAAPASGAPRLVDGPATPGFAPVPLAGNTTFEELGAGLTAQMRAALPRAPRAQCVA